MQEESKEVDRCFPDSRQFKRGFITRLNYTGKAESLLKYIPSDALSAMNHQCFQSRAGLVSMESHLAAFYALLNFETEDVRMVAICGMGGIGKTTIARTIYNENGRFFKYRAMLENVTQTCRESSHQGLLELQRTLLSQIIMKKKVEVWSVDVGADMIKRYCCDKKTLLVIDDVGDEDELEKLAGACDWFGPGSIIIVTTRDNSLLHSRRDMKLYEVPLLKDAEAYQLFTSKAFQDDDNIEDYEDIIRGALQYAQGLPLAIKVLGGLFRSKPKNEWASTLQALKSGPLSKIIDPLKESYESLNNYEKTTFLDIACFLKGQPVRHVRNILKCCDVNPDAVMGVLERKYLITIENKKVDMHDKLQEMGREIVLKGSSIPGKRSRLWDAQEIRDILTGEREGTHKIQGMKIELDAPEAVAFSEKAFEPLTCLRLFLAYKAQYSGNPIKFPKTLRCLEWEGCPSSSLPLNGYEDWELAGLYMRESKIQHIDHQFKLFRNLKFLYLSKSASLRKIPDLSSLPMLEILDAEGCTRLNEVDQSLGELDNLVCLNFLNCKNLHTFPRVLKSKSLEELTLRGCWTLSKFPEIHVRMDELKQLSLDDTAIDELPLSIENLVGLKELCLDGCKRLNTLPNSIYRLQSLQRVSLDGCSDLNKFPEFADSSGSSPFSQRPLSFPKVVYIDLGGCSLRKISFMKNLDCTFTLKSLDLSGNKLVTVPEFIGNFSALQVLRLDKCKQLRDIQGLPPNIRNLHAEGCESLERCVPLWRFLNSDSVNSSHWFQFSGCYKLSQDNSSLAIFPSIEDLALKSEISILHPGSDLPKWFTHERQNKEGLTSFSVNSEEYKNIAGLALCMIIGSDVLSKKSISCDIKVEINNQWAYSSQNHFESLGSDHIWLIYVPCLMISGWNENMNNRCNEFRVKFEESWGHLKCCGVHLVVKEDRQAVQTGDALPSSFIFALLALALFSLLAHKLFSLISASSLKL